MPDDNQVPQTQTAERKEEPKQPSALERIAEESYDALKKSVNYGLAFAGGALSTYIFGLKAGLSTWGGRVMRQRVVNQLRDMPTTSEKVRDKSIEATIITPAVFYGVNFTRATPQLFGLDNVVANISNYSVPISPFVVGATAIGVFTPVLSAFSNVTKYVVENKTFKGIVENFKKNYWKDLKKRLPLSAIGATSIGITYAYSALAPYLFPFLAATNMLYHGLIEEGKVMYRKLFYLSTYVPNFLNPFRLTSGAASASSKLYQGAVSGAYNWGTRINNLFNEMTKSTPERQETPSPQREMPRAA